MLGNDPVYYQPGTVPRRCQGSASDMQRVMDVIFRRTRVEPAIPECPRHHVPMRLRGKQGRPTRFTGQMEELYTLIYFCPVEGCNETGERKQLRTQIPVPGETATRPPYARLNDQR